MKNIFVLIVILAVALPVALSSRVSRTKQTVTNLLAESEKLITKDVIKYIRAVFVFKLERPLNGVWFLDLKNGLGKTGVGYPRQQADTTLTIPNSDDFFEMFDGTLDPMQAYNDGKVEVLGNTAKAMKLEKTLQKLYKARRNGEI